MRQNQPRHQLTKFFWQEEQPGSIVANLLNKEFKDLHEGKVRDAKIQYISRMDIGEFEFNNNTIVEKTIVDLFENSNKLTQFGVLITRDFNTIPEKNENYNGKFTTEKIQRIIEDGEKYFKLREVQDLLWEKGK